MQYLLFFISPILALPTILSGIRQGKRSSLFMMALFMGFFAYCTMPAQDLFRHFENYEMFSAYDLQDITYLDFSNSGIELYIFSIMGKLGIHFDYFRLFTLFTGFYLLSDMFYWKATRTYIQYTDVEYFNRYIIFLLFFDLFYTVMGLRYGYAICLYLYGIFMLIEKKNIFYAVLFLTFAYLIHGSFLYLSVASLGLYYARVGKKTIIFFLIVAFAVMTYFLTNYTEIIGARAEWYSSENKVTMYSNMTVNGLIGFFAPKLCAVPFAIILFRYNTQGSKWARMAISWLILSIICVSNAVFLYRIWWVFSALGIFVILDLEHLFGKFEDSVIQKLKCAAIFFIISNIIPYNSMFRRSDYYRLLFPVPIIIYENYEIKEILHRYPDAGTFYI